jgi:FkbH-like protein
VSTEKIKCLVWDLDNTLWRGILSEGDVLTLHPQAAHLIKTLDARGILQSVASKNDASPALAQLEKFQLTDYFLYPQIHWGPKSASIKKIAETINISTDTIAFIDDQAFERDEVTYSDPRVRCFDVTAMELLLELPEFNPRFLTDESASRRELYQHDRARSTVEEEFQGPKEEFLASLNMVFSVARAQEEDLHRLEELTARTHQLNTTGRIYSYEELDAFRTCAQHQLWVAALHDKYGPYGKIGLTLIQQNPELWTIKLMLMSCRVMSRGVGSILLNHVVGMARQNGVPLRAEMVLNERNRLMYMTYKFAGFTTLHKVGELEILQHDLNRVSPPPPYVQVNFNDY